MKYKGLHMKRVRKKNKRFQCVEKCGVKKYLEEKRH